MYVTWISPNAKEDCFRVGSDSRCFCGHLFNNHNKEISKNNRLKNNCQSCKCAGFRFIPRRPEELGQWWMPRRKGFNVN